MDLLAFLACGLLLAILVVLIVIAVTIRGLRSDICQFRSVTEHGMNYFMFNRQSSPLGSVGKCDGGFSVWVFRGGQWKLEGNYCLEGYEPGPPPYRSGLMEGYAVRQLAVKKRPQ